MRKRHLLLSLVACALPLTTWAQVPTDLKVSNVGSVSAEFSWTPAGRENAWDVRFLTTGDYLSWDFESSLGDWTTIDADGDGNTWTLQTQDYPTHGGSACVVSESWSTQTYAALTPDNWLVSPQIDLGGVFSFWVSAMDPDYSEENFAVYVSENGNTSPSDFTEVMAETMATSSYVQYRLDLSAFSGKGYVAIRHFDSTDMFAIGIDDATYQLTTLDKEISDVKENPYVYGELSPETNYMAQVSVAGKSQWSAPVPFTTLSSDTPPTNVRAVEAGYDFAVIDWAPSAGEKVWNLRYHTLSDNNVGFEDGSLPDGWTTLDADGDGNNWYVAGLSPHSGSNHITSASYINDVGKVTPDNWLISPKVQLGGSISFFAKGQDASYCAEHFAVFVSTKGTAAADFKQVSDEFVATADYVQYTVDLSAYSGQGYVAIRHFNCTDMYMLNVDDISIFGPGEGNDWITISNISQKPYTIDGLTANTYYEVQVQGVYGATASAWSASGGFSTWSDIILQDNDKNSVDYSLLQSHNGQTIDVTFSGRTFKKNGEWDSVVLPFAVGADALASSPLAGATIMEPTNATYDTSDVAILELTKVDAIEANRGYFIKWPNTGEQVSDPVFKGVTIDYASESVQYNIDSQGMVEMNGLYFNAQLESQYFSQAWVTDGSKNELRNVTSADTPLLPFRVILFSQVSGVRFSLPVPTAISEVQAEASGDGWYALDGTRLSSRPAQKGIYITGGKKVVVK